MTSQLNDFKFADRIPDGARTCLSLVTQIRDKIGRLVEEEGAGDSTEEEDVAKVEALVATSKQQQTIVNSLLGERVILDCRIHRVIVILT